MDPIKLIFIILGVACGVAYGVGITFKQIAASNHIGITGAKPDDYHMWGTLKINGMSDGHKILFF